MAKLIGLLVFFFCTSLHSQNNLPEISFGILYADIKTIDEAWEEGNTWRRGYWASLSQSLELNKWLLIEAGITYQERLPLEVLPFPFGDSSQQIPGVSNQWVFSKYPTNPQNRLFNNSVDEYVRFPNFKYLNLEVVPCMVWGSKLKLKLGVGLFGGILLNRKKTTVTKEDLPNEEAFFEPPFNVYGEVLYHKYDYGWMPKICIDYEFHDNIIVGIACKSYQSLVRLNDTFVDSDLAYNMRWVAFAGGFSFRYIPNKKKKE